MLRQGLLLSKNFNKSLVRRAHLNGGSPGENIPFKIGNKYRLTAGFIVFWGTGLALPFIVMRYQLLKNRTQA